ncbi:MAG: TonB-dependent receptor [Gammaproteobacteria bacterium]|nr:TonB-dependent receptor [Gammaproteobacteria bacterium]
MKHRFMSRVPGLIIASLCAPVAMSAVAAAQGAAGSGSAAGALEVIVVTAQKREEGLQGIPVAVSAFSSSALEAIGATDFTAIGEYVPNLNIMPQSGTNGTAITLRGIGSAEPSAAIDPKVGLYVDGVYVARNTATVFELDLERIEVLRGPQGTLWGKNTTGGSINVITAKPTGELGLKQELGFGEYGRFRSKTVLDLNPSELGELGSVNLKFSYLKTMSDGWANRVNDRVAGPHDLGEVDSDSLRFAAAWNLNEDIVIDYAFDHINRNGTSRQDQLLYAPPSMGADRYASRRKRLERFSLDTAGRDEITIDAHTLVATWDLGDVTLKSITGYRDSNLQYDPDLDGTPVEFTARLLSTGAMSTGGLYNVYGTRDDEQFSQELQAVGTTLDGRLDYVAGLYYFDEEGTESTIGSLYYDALAPFVFFNDTSKTFTIDNKSMAVYGQATYTLPVLDDRLRVTLGGRYTDDDKDVHKTVHNGVPADMPGQKSWNHFSPAGTIDFQASEDVNVYLRVAEAYNAGIFNVRSSAASFSTPADEETVVSYELGAKTEWFEHRLRLNTALFYSEFDDMQSIVYVAGESTALNVGSTDIWGVEVELLASPVAGLTLGLSYGYLDYEINEFVYGQIDVTDSAVLPYMPENTASGFIEFRFLPLAIGTVALRLDATYKDEVAFSPLNSATTQADDYALVNARITLSELPFESVDASIAVWGKNLADEDYQIFGIDYAQFQTGSFGDPRSFGVDLRMEF